MKPISRRRKIWVSLISTMIMWVVCIAITYQFVHFVALLSKHP